MGARRGYRLARAALLDDLADEAESWTDLKTTAEGLKVTIDDVEAARDDIVESLRRQAILAQPPEG